MESVAQLAGESPANPECLLASATEEQPVERRREPRFATDRLTVYQVADTESRERTLCRILDVSRSGMRLRMQQSLSAGTKVRVTLREMYAFAQVRYTVPAGDGFDHGIQVYQVLSAPTAAEQPA